MNATQHDSLDDEEEDDDDTLASSMVFTNISYSIVNFVLFFCYRNQLVIHHL
jgi:hypothetical protein